MTIGVNWKAVWKPVWKTVWQQKTPIPPIPTKPKRTGMGGYGGPQLEPRWKQIQKRDIDDIELIKIILEFLSRV